MPLTWKGPLPPDDPIFTGGVNFVFKRSKEPLDAETQEFVDQIVEEFGELSADALKAPGEGSSPQ